MLNPFKVYALAADARRALVSLSDPEFAAQVTLTSKVNKALNRLSASRNARLIDGKRIAMLEGKLDAANAKINRMTSGLKRGATPKRGSKVSA